MQCPAEKLSQRAALLSSLVPSSRNIRCCPQIIQCTSLITQYCFHFSKQFDPFIPVYIKQSQKYQALSKCSQSFQSILLENKAFEEGLLSKQDIYIEMEVDGFENSLKSSRYLAILVMNFIKNTVYIDIRTLKVIKKNRQLDNPTAEDYCR